jgi:hypothetical protein
MFGCRLAIRSAQSAANAVKALVEDDMSLVHAQITGYVDDNAWMSIYRRTVM